MPAGLGPPLWREAAAAMSFYIAGDPRYVVLRLNGRYISISDIRASAYANYIAQNAATLKVSTLERRLSSLAKAHRLANLPDPTKSELVKTVLRAIRRAHGSRQEQTKPVTRQMLEIICSSLGQGRHDIRDRALFLVGFASGMRRSELCSLHVGQVTLTSAGAELQKWQRKDDPDNSHWRFTLSSAGT